LIDGSDPHAPLQLSPAQLKSRRARNIAIALAVGFFCLLFYVVTIAKLGVAVLDRPL